MTTPTEQELAAAREIAEHKHVLLGHENTELEIATIIHKHNEQLRMETESLSIAALKDALKRSDEIAAERLINLNIANQKIETLTTELSEAQQWIDSEPDWKDKYMANYQLLTTERDQLAARCAELEKVLRDYQYGSDDECIGCGRTQSCSSECDFKILTTDKSFSLTRLQELERKAKRDALLEAAEIAKPICNIPLECGSSVCLGRYDAQQAILARAKGI